MNRDKPILEFTMTRVFDAPRQAVWEAWTDPRQVEQWWGPHGFTNRVRAWDARPGGKIDLDMIWPDGKADPMTGQFVEVTAPERIVMTTGAVPDAQGRPQLEGHDTITFAEEGSGMTRLTVHELITRAEPTVSQALEGAEEGMKQTLDKLEAYLVLHATIIS